MKHKCYYCKTPFKDNMFGKRCRVCDNLLIYEDYNCGTIINNKEWVKQTFRVGNDVKEQTVLAYVCEDCGKIHYTTRKIQTGEETRFTSSLPDTKE